MRKVNIKSKNTAFMTVDLKAVQHNYNFFKNFISENCIMGAVIKSNAQGLGIEKIAKTLYDNGCKNFFVAYPLEGAIVRKIVKDDNVKIRVFSGFFNENKTLFKKYNLIPILNSVYEMMTFKKFCQKEKNNFLCSVKVDTGLSRHGLTMEEMNEYKNFICDELNCDLIISHLACSEEKDHPKNKEQLQNFLKIKNLFGNKFKYSLSATCGVFLGKNFHFDMVRVGYGLFCNGASKKLKNASSVYAKILQVKNIKKGDTVGYGCEFVAEKDMKIAVLGIGYAFGLFKNFKDNKYWTWINGQKCNFIGKISMEYSTIDVTDIYDKYLQIGSAVELLGEHRTITEMAHDLNTNPSDVALKFGKLEKIYLND